MFIYRRLSNKEKDSCPFGFTEIRRALLESVAALVVMLVVAVLIKYIYLSSVMHVHPIDVFSVSKDAGALAGLPHPTNHLGVYVLLVSVTFCLVFFSSY